MRIDKIILNNFRCFKQLEVTFHPQMTVLIAPNGAGKTTVLDAVRIALWPFVKGFDLGSQTGKSATIQIDDVRLRLAEQDMEPVLPAAVSARACQLGEWEVHEWSQRREQIKVNTKTLGDGDTIALTNFAKKRQKFIYGDQEGNSDAPIDLPLIVYLGTGRLWYQGRYTAQAEDKKLDASAFSRLWGYQNCLTAASSYKQFETWYGWVFRSYRELQMDQLENRLKPQDQKAFSNFAAAIQVVQRSINSLTQQLTGWCDLQYRSSMGQKLVMVHPEHGYMPLDMLSDGLRNMVAMVSDIAFRCIKLNPHLGEYAAKETEGIVLIDEVDMFLHPSWQQTVLGSLQQAFPKIQFIVTTHSPQVLTSVDASCVRMFKEYVDPETGMQKILVKSADLQTKGVASSDLLARIMGVNPIPPVEEAKWFSDYTAKIENGTHEDADGLALRQKLEAHFGTLHPQMLDADRLIRFQAFKLRKKSTM